MDHLGLGRFDSLMPVYQESSLEYTPPFHDFPERAGWRLGENHEITRVDSKWDFQQLLQSWLFFGLIRAVVYDDGDGFKQVDFVTNGRRNLYTAGLKEVLEDWEKREMQDEAGQSMRMIRAQVALDLARGVVRKYCSVEEKGSGQQQEEEDALFVDPKIALCLMVLGETLTNAKTKIVNRTGFNIRGWHGDAQVGWGTPGLVLELMERDRWCKRTVHILRAQLSQHATSLLSAYASHRDFPFEGHGECTKDKCCFKASNADGQYETKHHLSCHDAKKCTMMGPVVEKIAEYIDQGKIPLLRFQQGQGANEELQVEVVECTPYTEFATISHVWADGYGNPRENKLWRCQIYYFRDLFRRAQDLSKARAGRDILFWIDTLAIPVDDKYRETRKKAIKQIHDIYSRASYTIVIDNGLCRQPPDVSSYTLTAMRILVSGWMRRLWTLQEAYLSRKLLFAFDGGQVVDIEEIEDRYALANYELTSNLPSAARNYFHNLLGPDRKARIHDLSPRHNFGLLASVWKAAQWRTTSRPEHETLALATLLNLEYNRPMGIEDTGLLPSHQPPGEEPTRNATTQTESSNAAGGSSGVRSVARKERKTPSPEKLDALMKELWELLNDVAPGAIPPGIIFLPGPRLNIHGFGWAPRTWMSCRGTDHPDPLSSMKEAATLSLDKGLSVQYPGFLLHAADRQVLVNSAFWFPSDNTLLEWYRVEQADDKVDNPLIGNSSAEREKPIAIILSRSRPREDPEIGLLVEIKRVIKQRILGDNREKKLYCTHIICRVRVSRETSEVRLKERKRYIVESRKYEEKFICGEVLDDDQGWYVDSPVTATREVERRASDEVPPSTAVASRMKKLRNPLTRSDSISKPMGVRSVGLSPIIQTTGQAPHRQTAPVRLQHDADQTAARREGGGVANGSANGAVVAPAPSGRAASGGGGSKEKGSPSQKPADEGILGAKLAMVGGSVSTLGDAVLSLFKAQGKK